MKWISKPPLGTPLNWAHPLNKGLVGFWLFNEGMGDKAYDISGNRNHGTLTNMAFPPTAASGWNPSRKGCGLQFDGSNDIVDAGNVPSLQLTSFTVSGRIKTSTNKYIMSKWKTVPAQQGWILSLRSDTGRLSFQSNTNVYFPGGGSGLSDNTFHVVTSVVNVTSLTMYVDGSVYYNTTIIGITESNTNLIIGSNDDDVSRPFDGIIDEVRIWNRVLSAPEVQELYINPYSMFL